MGMGCILRHNQGVFQGCFATKMFGVLSAKEAKVFGLREAISWVLSWGFSSVVFELDSKTVVNAFHSLQPDESKFGMKESYSGSQESHS